MDQCLIVETRNPLDHREFEQMAALALGLSRRGVPTTLFLTDNAVLGARPGVTPALQDLVEGNVAIRVDALAMSERGIARKALMAGLAPADVGLVVDALAAGAAVLWR